MLQAATYHILLIYSTRLVHCIPTHTHTKNTSKVAKCKWIGIHNMNDFIGNGKSVYLHFAVNTTDYTNMEK